MQSPARISLITLGASNLTISCKFYETWLGIKPSSASNSHIYFYQLGELALAIWSKQSLADDAQIQSPSFGFGNLTLARNLQSKRAVDLEFEKAAAAGATLLKKPLDTFWGGYSGYIADPDNHVWELPWNPYFSLDSEGRLKLPDSLEKLSSQKY